MPLGCTNAARAFRFTNIEIKRLWILSALITLSLLLSFSQEFRDDGSNWIDLERMRTIRTPYSSC